MYSNIIELSTKPLRKVEYVTADYFVENMELFLRLFSKIDDYIYDSEHYETDKTYFLDMMNYISCNEDNSINFKKNYKTKWFKKIFLDIKERVNKLTLDEFCEPYTASSLIFNLEHTHSYYIFITDFDLCVTLDTFIREYSEPNVNYYIGGILTYHA